MSSSGVTVISSPQSVVNSSSPKFYSDVCTLAKVASPFLIVKGSNSIINSINNILTCPVNTRAWNWTYGSRLMYFLFEPLGDITAQKIQADAVNSIAQFEPRVTVDTNNSSVTTDPRIPGYNVVIVAIIKSTGGVVEYSRSFPVFSS